MFSADVVTGEKAKEIGLIDELGLMDDVISELYPKTKIVDFSKKSPLEEISQKFKTLF